MLLGKNERYNILNTAPHSDSRNTPCAHHAITQAEGNTTKSYHAVTDCFQNGDFSFQIPRHGGNCFSGNDLRNIVGGSKQDSTALITALFPHAQFHEENLPSGDAWRRVRGGAELSASRRNKVIDSQCAFSRLYVGSRSALLTYL